MVEQRTDQSFKRASRLTDQAEFRRVFARPLVSKDRYFRVLARKNHAGRSRLGMAVSVKVDKRAVRRNRLKRLVRESFRRQPPSFSDLGLDLVVLPTRAAATMCSAVLNAGLEKHWQRLEQLAHPGSRSAQGSTQGSTEEKN